MPAAVLPLFAHGSKAIRNLGEPNLGEPNLGEPNLGEPNLGEPNLGEPNLSEPNLGEPNLGEPNLGEPNLGEPNLGPSALIPPAWSRASPSTPPNTKLSDRLPVGRLIELSGAQGRTTFAVSMVIRAQQRDEPVVWVQLAGSSLYPPDLAESGVDLDALIVVQVPRDRVPHGQVPRDRVLRDRVLRDRGPDRQRQTDGVRLAKASELLLRSGAFGLLVIDLETAPRGDAWQGRLGGLARTHGCQVVLLTSSGADAPSLGPMVGMRIVPGRTRTAPGRFVLDHAILKNKTGQIVRQSVSAMDGHRAPAGLG